MAIPNDPVPAPPTLPGSGPASGNWWDPRNWSIGGQKVLGGGGVAGSTPKTATSPYAGSTPMAQAGGKPSGLGTSTSAPTGQDAVDADAAWMKAFRDSMNAPLDFNDPYVKNILDNARAGTIQGANNAGIYGGYSQNQGEQAWVKGAAGLQQQNRGLALQAAGMGASVDQNTRGFNYDVAKDKYTNDMDIWKYNQDKNSGLGGMIGGGIGAIGGAIPGIATLDPALAFAGGSAGWNVGSKIGAGIGGNSGSGPPVFKPGGY